MQLNPTRLEGAWLIEPERHVDVRGFFARTWCHREFTDHGLDGRLVQCSVSFNKQAGTLRGMHYQATPKEEVKLVRCTRGSVYDVIVDLRPESATFAQHVGFELTAENHRALYVPKGFAHGFQTLVDDTEVFYQMSDYFDAPSARGFHYADPELGIDWPLPVSVISQKDAELGWLER
ncbi:dTDP-4-dehydrorhamnose 3,5-epimerase [Allorhodopirellula solitaria]|uniref:dTDP-4-dehydrorhamnose 3,5-epimerase n=1 Tax=Allorhodopirellula solitaria TaxID=2527987 RepID=A0A5C5X2H1_9BACT|nr:dTDP-4-dehydrorhamnose 3,5-epimerase [Allorhodopirellula solitaria]TWT56353.1 dTDP-4-dehydrorhamnose 3,5-epimerase [Allorhodopirellula solitaria]